MILGSTGTGGTGRRVFRVGPLIALVLLGLSGGPVHAADRLGRVRAENIVRCAAEPRPGFADTGEDGRIAGLAVDLCRAVAIALLGPDGRVAFGLAEGQTAFDAIRQGDADIAFLSDAAIADHRLAADLLPGPVVFIDPIAVMVPVASTAQSPRDLGGRGVCVLIGSASQRALEGWLAGSAITVSRLAFEEEVELLDAYNVGNCEAAADHATHLARMRQTGGINRLRSRILAPPLALTPLLAATPVADGAWAGLVSWTLHALISADGQPSDWRAMPAAPLAGLRPAWLTEVRAALGGYAAMRDRHLGAPSALGLAAWPNLPWPEGLLPRVETE